MNSPSDRDEADPKAGLLGGLTADVAGAVVGASLAGPAGAAVGGALPTVLKATVDSVLRRRAQTRAANAETMMRLAITAAEVPAEEFLRRIERDLGSERLTSAALEAAVETSYATKLTAIARSLATGLTADGRPEVDEQLLIIDALREMEPAHVWLLDRVVRWEPLTGSIISGASPPYGEAISIAIGNKPSRRRWTSHKPWPLGELRAGYARHKTPASFDPVLGALVRRGILSVGDRVPDSSASGGAADQVVEVTGFGLQVHALLLDSEALEPLDEGELDITASAAWATRGFPGWAKLETYAKVLGMSDEEARRMTQHAADRPESHGFRIESNRPPGQAGVLARVANAR